MGVSSVPGRLMAQWYTPSMTTRCPYALKSLLFGSVFGHLRCASSHAWSYCLSPVMPVSMPGTMP